MPKKAASSSNAAKLVDGLLKGERLALSRVLTKIERRDADFAELMKAIHPRAGRAQILGITGPPGAGKSTLINALIKEFRSRGKRVAAVAVDPSSPFTGGAILGDRIRMQEHARDEGVFIRSLGSHGALGGLSRATRGAVAALDAAGFDPILVETVGVGQSEWDIRRLAHTTLVVLVPESGDSVQVMKAGLMEIADLFVVNKADRPGAEKLERELRGWVEDPGLSAPQAPSSWRLPVLLAESTRGKGIPELVQALEEHRRHLQNTGEWDARVRLFLEAEIREILQERVESQVAEFLKTDKGQQVLNRTSTRKIDPLEAADVVSSTILKT